MLIVRLWFRVSTELVIIIGVNLQKLVSWAKYGRATTFLVVERHHNIVKVHDTAWIMQGCAQTRSHDGKHLQLIMIADVVCRSKCYFIHVKIVAGTRLLNCRSTRLLRSSKVQTGSLA